MTVSALQVDQAWGRKKKEDGAVGAGDALCKTN